MRLLVLLIPFIYSLQFHGVSALEEVIQIEAPVRSSYEGASCQQTIVQHEFAESYGIPFVGTYTPPENCTFTTTIFNLSIVSAGINYDRLGLLFFGDIEIWRTSTAMPTRTGIYWTYQKDMTIFDTLLRSQQKIIFDIGNLYDSVFTAAYNATITALYYNDPYPLPLTPADLILPITTQSAAENKSSVFSLPGNATVSLTVPSNAKRAVVSTLASGNGDEEFWYLNVPTQYIDTFNNSNLLGYSPFREVQLLIDGQLAGVSWPFPIVFTGGINPGLWNPIVGIDAFNLPSFEIDVSPWLGILCDGVPHNFSLAVVGYDSETGLGTVGQNWYVTGSVFIWVDGNGNKTTGSSIQSSTPAPAFDLKTDITTSGNTNTSLWISLTASRSLSYSAVITTSSGPRTLTWSQSLSYINTMNNTNLALNTTFAQLTTSHASFYPSSPSSSDLISNTEQFPIAGSIQYVVPVNQETTNSTLISSIDRSLLTTTIPILPYLTSPSSFSTNDYESLETRQNGSCVYYWNNTYYEFAGAIDPSKGSVGATEQWFSYDAEGVAYGRFLEAVDGYVPRLVKDDESGASIVVPETEGV